MRYRLADESTLAGKASRAFGWSFASSALSRLGTLSVGIVLARILGPRAFGTYAVALVALSAMQKLNDVGVSKAVVRSENPEEIVPTGASISVLLSVMAYTGCFFGAPAFAAVMGAPGAANVVRVLALAILIDGFCNTATGLLERNFRQKRLVVATQVGGWLGTGVSLTLALLHLGAMSLAIGQLIGALIAGAMLVAFAPDSLRFGFRVSQARELMRFGLPLTGANFIALGVISVDQVIVGHVLGAVALGYYVLALNISKWPLNMFGRPVRSVAPAIFAKLQYSPPAMRNAFLLSAGLLSAITLPICAEIGFSGIPFISVIYGPRWLAASEPLMWLTLVAGLRILFELAYDYMVVLGRTRFLLLVQALWLAGLIPALIIGIRARGIYGAGVAEGLAATIIVVPGYLGGLRSTGTGIWSLCRHLARPVGAATVTGVVGAVAAALIQNYLIALFVSAVTTVVVVCVLVYRMRGVIGLLGSPGNEKSESEGEAASARAADELVTQGRRSGALITSGTPLNPAAADVGKSDSGRHGLIESGLGDGELTGPLSVYLRDGLWPSTDGVDLSATSPLYRITIASLQWNPEELPFRGSTPGAKKS